MFEIIAFIIIAGLVMVATHVLYDLAAAVIPVVALIMVILGIVVGFVVAVRNISVEYKKVYLKKGK